MGSPALPSPHLRLQSIMVVDDSPVQRAQAVQLCREQGIALIYEACHGQDALDQLMLLRLKPDLLLIDLQMPIMDGVELITLLHQHELYIPLLVVSSHSSDILQAIRELTSTLQLPMLGTLTKPLQKAQLAHVLHTLDEQGAPTHPRQRPRPNVPFSTRELCHAIESDALDVHYQPKVDMRTGLVRGMEVLARWTHPQYGAVPPDQFIAVAEKEQLIYDLTLCILRKSIRQAAQWQASGFTPKLAINLSPLLLKSAGIVTHIANIADEYGVPHSHLVLEVTESAGIEHLGNAIALLTRLRLKGFGLSIDDYGTGFSSMQQLARLPFTELKIDRSLVHGAHTKPNLGVILASAIEMAQRLQLTSVAEGIETMEDWRLLQSYGCTIGQGYLIGRPMPAADVQTWLRSHRERLPQLRLQRPVTAAPASPLVPMH